MLKSIFDEEIYKREAKIHGEECASSELLILQECLQELTDEEFEFFEKIIVAEHDRRHDLKIEEWANYGGGTGR